MPSSSFTAARGRAGRPWHAVDHFHQLLTPARSEIAPYHPEVGRAVPGTPAITLTNC